LAALAEIVLQDYAFGFIVLWHNVM